MAIQRWLRHLKRLEMEKMMSSLIHQLNHLQNIDSAKYNKFSDLATDCLIVGAILIVISALIIIKSGINLLVSKRMEYVMLTLFIMGILTAFASIPLSYVANKTKTSEINCKISRINKEMPSVINTQTAKYPYCVKINGNNGFNETIVFLPTKKDAINYVKANSDAKRIFAANYITLSENGDQLKEGSNTLLSMNVDQMQVEPTALALHKLFNESIENN